MYLRFLLMKMKFAISLLVITLLVPVEIYGSFDFECPPADLIYPCTCTAFPKSEVVCNDVKSLDTVRNALVHRFKTPLPCLRVSNVHEYQLPHHAFNNITTKKLYLKGSSFRNIDDNAFDGQNSLGLLVLSDDRLTEFPSAAIKHLSGLRTLSVAENFIMKIYEDSVRYLHNLKYLYLPNNRLSSIEQNSFPRSLVGLVLSKNLLTSLNGSVENLPNLDVLLLSNNRLVDVNKQFDGLYQLTHLNLDMNNIHDISDNFNDLKSLRYLNLAYNNLEKIEDGLYPLTKLRKLNVSYNYITEINEDLFKELNSIEILDLSGNFIENVCQAIAPLKNLEELYLSNTNLKNLDYDCFQGMKNLRVLDLSHNELTNIDAVTGHSFPNLRQLYLQNNKLQNFRHGLKNIKYLEVLNIENNEFSNIKKHRFMHNVKLGMVRIGGNPWDCTDQFLDVLKDLETRNTKIVGAPDCYLTENLI
ncbi:leucine-rich repeat-containing protein 15 [Parasteatoda tepidariorum]|uniref:leucine-rich repeat-containing protein 15 n=1 Tax=Parasteatoda tepidariorum TaxID=114398 RepID=UPI00077F9C08|nr:leucine-rich repeat-containing protein 15 [Parasteatoda tepidariorum]